MGQLRSKTGSQPKRRSSDNLIKHIVSVLEQDIAFGRILPRERLVEDDLIERFNAGRHGVRAALMQLAAMGIVTRHRNKGAIVKDLPPDEVEDLFAIRELLEGRAAELLPFPPSKDLSSRLLAIHEAYGAAVRNGDTSSAYHQNNLFHSTLFQACGNPQLAEAIRQFALKSHTVRSYSIADPNLLANSYREHGEILDAMKAGDRSAFVARVKAHLVPAKVAYIEAYHRRFGTARKDSPSSNP